MIAHIELVRLICFIFAFVLFVISAAPWPTLVPGPGWYRLVSGGLAFLVVGMLFG